MVTQIDLIDSSKSRVLAYTIRKATEMSFFNCPASNQAIPCHVGILFEKKVKHGFYSPIQLILVTIAPSAVSTFKGF
jgi:hypothetical protein